MREDKQKPVVGQEIFSLSIGNMARRTTQELRPVIVTKVGRKYFYVCPLGQKEHERWHRKVEIRTWREASDFSPDFRLFASEQDWIDEKEAKEINERVRSFFPDFGSTTLSLKKLKAIAAIIFD